MTTIWMVFGWQGFQIKLNQPDTHFLHNLHDRYGSVVCVFLFIAPSVSAVDIRIVPTGAGVDLVVVHGEILPGDADRFLTVVGSEKVDRVLLESPGGSVIDGLFIGRAIRSAGLATGVAPGTTCASACALAWLAGTTRYIDASALVGFHAAYVEENGQASESGVGNALVGAYLNELGLGFDAVVLVSSAAPEEMNWLNAAKAQQAGIDVVLLDGDGTESRVEQSVTLRLPSGFRWIVLESSTSSTLLKTAGHADQIVRTRNGYFAAVIGPYEKSVAESIRSTSSYISDDAYLSSGNGFLFSISR